MRSDHLYSTIDAHAGGQPLRIVTHGVPPLKGKTLREQRHDLRTNHDLIRRRLLLEPRGHADMYGAVLLPSLHDHADYGVIFMTNGGYSTMCGHGIIALTTALLETGAHPFEGQDGQITYETPAGLITARATIKDGRVVAVRFRNVPAFRLVKDLAIDIDGRALSVDVAYGGAWYAIARAEDLGVYLDAADAPQLIQQGMAVKRAVSNLLDIVHPEDEDIAGLYGTIITGPPKDEDSTLRNATIYADGAVDRSPCGTGTSALVACRQADGLLKVGESFVSESLIDTAFLGRIVEDTTVGDYQAVVSEVSGRGAITGMHQFLVTQGDAVGDGFLIR